MPIGNWLADLELYLHNAGLDKPYYFEERIRFVHEQLALTFLWRLTPLLDQKQLGHLLKKVQFIRPHPGVDSMIGIRLKSDIHPTASPATPL